MAETNTEAKSPSQKKLNTLRIISAAEAVVILGLLIFLAWDVFINSPGTDDKAVPAGAVIGSLDDEEEEIRVRPFIEKEETFYQLDGKKILMNDGTYGEIYMPVFSDVPACELDMDSMVRRNGYSFYKDDKSVTSFAGVDVSEHQGDINWSKAKAAGLDFAIIRIGYRTYGGGEIVLDKNFERNIKEADAAGIKVGAYFFSQAVTTDEAIEEADAVIDAIKPFNITYPVIFDWELIYGDSARTDAMTVEGLADCCISFCERVRSAGYKPMIYQNKNTAMMKLDLPRLTDYDFWLAEYGAKPTYYYDYKIWQYASDGYVPGINGNVDMNISFVDYGAE